MILIGVAGRAGAGKDTVGDYLVRAYGFRKFSFSDALYREVAATFGLESEEILRDRETKDRALFDLALHRCTDEGFLRVASNAIAVHEPIKDLYYRPRSPRWILQTWGTEYRRVQDPDYWIKRAAEWMAQRRAEGAGRFVNTSVRFINEVDFIRGNGGQVWHVFRRDLPAMDNATHVSEVPLPLLSQDFVLWNTDTVPHLETRIDLAMDDLLRKAA